MSTTVETPPVVVTPADLLAMPDGVEFELVDGQLVERNVSGLSSLVTTEVGRRLANHNEAIGSPAWIFGPDMGVQCFPGRPNKVRKPDVSFVPRERASLQDLEERFLHIPPTLAVEVDSPNDIAENLEVKEEEYLSAGVRLIWIIYPLSRTARVVLLDGSVSKLRFDDILDGEDLLTGFTCRVGDLMPAALAPTVA